MSEQPRFKSQQELRREALATGRNTAKVDGTYEGHMLEEGGKNLLEKSYSPSVSRTSNLVHKVIELSQEEGDK